MALATLDTLRARLAALPMEAAAHPERFGEGTALLFTCAHPALQSALGEAKKMGIDARGVGRGHVLIELDAIVPDAAWVANQGDAICAYFEKIGGRAPQLAIDSNAGDLPDGADVVH